MALEALESDAKQNRPDYWRQHEASARSVPLTTIRLDSLLHDIDEPEDLRYLLSHAAETATHRLLAEMRVGERLEA